MLEVGNFQGPNAFNESRSHFGGNKMFLASYCALGPQHTIAVASLCFNRPVTDVDVAQAGLWSQAR
jgi:hypothetical protein